MLSGLDLTYKTAPQAVVAKPGTIDVAVTGINNTLHTRHFDGTSWSPAGSWENAFDGIEDTGSVVSRYEGRVDVFTRRDNNAQVLSIYKDYSSSNDPWRKEYFAIISESPPAVVIPGPDSAEFLWVNRDDHARHWHSIPGGRWTYPTTLGTQKVSSTLTGVSNEGRVDLFALAPDQTVVHNSYQLAADVWSGWETLGTKKFQSSIAAVVRKGSNNIELFGLGLDNAFWHRTGNGSHWPVDWDSHKGVFKSAPTLVSSCPGEYDVFGIGADKQVLYSHWSEKTGWTPTYGQWTKLGGSFQDFF